MAYCTVDEVRGVLARDVAQATGTAATLLDADLLEYHIGAAQAEVDARLTGRYKVPFPDDGVPALVKSLTVDVAAYLATLTYRQSKDLAQFDPVVLRYQRALELMKGLADGTIDLPPGGDPGDGGGDVEPTGSATVRNPYIGDLFTPDTWGLGYQRGRLGNWHGR